MVIFTIKTTDFEGHTCSFREIYEIIIKQVMGSVHLAETYFRYLSLLSYSIVMQDNFQNDRP